MESKVLLYLVEQISVGNYWRNDYMCKDKKHISVWRLVGLM